MTAPTAQTQVVSGLSLTRFENPLAVALTDPDGHAVLRPAGSAGAGSMVLTLRNTSASDLRFIPAAGGACHLTLLLRKAVLDPAILTAQRLSVTGQGGEPALRQATWAGTLAATSPAADWVTLRLTAALAGETLLHAGSDLSLSLGLSGTTGSGARGAQVTVATDPGGVRLGTAGLDAKAILHLSLMATSGASGSGQGPLSAAFRGPFGNRLTPGAAGHNLTLHVTAAAKDVAAFWVQSGLSGTRPMQIRFALPSGLSCDGILPPANVSGGRSDDGSGLWRFTVAAAVYTTGGALDLVFTFQNLRCDVSVTALGAVDLPVEVIDLPVPDQASQRLVPQLILSGMVDAVASSPHTGQPMNAVSIFGTGNVFYSDGTAMVGNSSIALSPDGSIATSGSISTTHLNTWDAHISQGLTVDTVTASTRLTVAGVSINGTMDRNIFRDKELSTGAGLRVGTAWGMPGIYAEDATCVVGGYTGVNIQNGVITVSVPPTPLAQPALHVDKAGSLHVMGTPTDETRPRASLHIHATPAEPHVTEYFQYMDSYGGVHFWNGSWSGKYALWAEGRLYSSDGLNVGSDARLKRVVGPSDPVQDLDRLAAIEVVEYRLVTQSPDDPATQRKVIAQQVEQVYPQAVSRNIGEVPDIYAAAQAVAGWIRLGNDLAVGDRVRILRDGGAKDAVETVTEATSDGFRTDTAGADGGVFVYGRAVDDLRAVDYDALSMLTLSATKALKSRVETLEGDLAAARADIARLSAQVAALLARALP